MTEVLSSTHYTGTGQAGSQTTQLGGHRGLELCLKPRTAPKNSGLGVPVTQGLCGEAWRTWGVGLLHTPQALVPWAGACQCWTRTGSISCVQRVRGNHGVSGWQGAGQTFPGVQDMQLL